MTYLKMKNPRVCKARSMDGGRKKKIYDKKYENFLENTNHGVRDSSSVCRFQPFTMTPAGATTTAWRVIVPAAYGLRNP